MSGTLLIVMQPREVAECLASLAALPCDRAHVRFRDEGGACEEINRIVAEGEYERYSVVADDVIVPPAAWEAVEDLAGRAPDACSTGWCQLGDDKSNLANLSDRPLPEPPPRPSSYSFPEVAHVLAGPDPRPTGFVGMCLTTMSAALWRAHPMGTYLYGVRRRAYGSDYRLSRSLAASGTPMLAAVGGRCVHVKERWNHLDRDPRRRLLVGEREPDVLRLGPGEPA